MAAHRYWRLLIDATNQPTNYVHVAELYLRTAIGGAQAATGGAASATSDQGASYDAAKAFDGLTTTGWASGLGSVAGKWLKYDLGAGNDKDIIEFALAGHTTFYAQWPRDFRLQWSDDDVSWTTKFTIRNHTNYLNAAASTFSADSVPDEAGVDGAFWRVRVSAVQLSSYVVLEEVKMFVDGSVTNQCTGGTPYASSCAPPGRDEYAFDGITGDGKKWQANGTANWIGYKFASAKPITSITITAAVASYQQAPKDFVVEYWDGAAYQTVLSVTGEVDWNITPTRTYSWGASPAAAARPSVFVAM